GISAWLGGGKGKPLDLRKRVEFFEANPCPIRTLILLRIDGDEALTGGSKAVYDNAIEDGHDLRIQKYELEDLHALMAFSGWHQVAAAEAESAKEMDPNAESIFRQLLAEVSKNLLGWINAGGQPVERGSSP